MSIKTDIFINMGLKWTERKEIFNINGNLKKAEKKEY